MKKYMIFISLLLLSFVLVTYLFFVRPHRLYGDCMEPLYRSGNRCFVNKLAPYYRNYKVGDVIIVSYEDRDWIARIVALENDTIKISDHAIEVNGKELVEKDVPRNWTAWDYGTYAIDKEYKVALQHVFTLSDDLSAHHDDSRVWGPIPYSSIIGVVW